jgi:HTH-type transcriptional regulator / antitoxin HigA
VRIDSVNAKRPASEAIFANPTAELERVTEAWPPISRAVRVPHSDADYREMVELLDRVTDEVGEDENDPLASLMDVLGVLIEKYED